MHDHTTMTGHGLVSAEVRIPWSITYLASYRALYIFNIPAASITDPGEH